MLTRHRTRVLFATTALAAVLVSGGCLAGGGSDAQTSEPARAHGQASDGGHGSTALTDNTALTDEAADAAGGGSAAQTGGKDQTVDPRQQAIIATGTISLRTRDVAQARAEVQQVLDVHQGTISHEETSTADDGELERARMVLRIPVEDFSEATAALEQVAALESSDYGEEDVTTRVKDVEARIRAQETSLQRVEALLAEAEDLETLLRIEQELTQRQAELDSLTSQQKWLDDQTDLATVTVHLERSEEAEEKDTDRAGFLGGLTDGWDSFVSAASGTALVLGFVLPWLALLGLLLGAGWVVRRMTRTGQPVVADGSDE